MNSGESRVFQDWLKNLAQPKVRNHKEKQHSSEQQQQNKKEPPVKQNPPMEKERGHEQFVNEMFVKSSEVKKQEPVIVQPPKEQKNNIVLQEQVVQPIKQTVHLTEEVTEIPPITFNLNDKKEKNKPPTSVTLDTPDKPVQLELDPEVIKALQVLQSNGMELPLAVNQVIQSVKDTEQNEVPIESESILETTPKEQKFSQDTDSQEVSETKIEQEVTTYEAEPPIERESIVVTPKEQDFSQDTDLQEVDSDALVARIEETFVLHPMISPIIHSPSFFDAVKVDEKYLYILDEPTQEDMLQTQFAQLGVKNIEVVAPFSNGRGIELFEMDVQTMVETLLSVMPCEIQQHVRVALMNHLYILKLTNRYDFQAAMDMFNCPNDFYYQSLEPFKINFEITEQEWEFPKNVKSMINGIISWLSKAYQPVFIGRGEPSLLKDDVYKGQKEYVLDLNNMENTIDTLNTLQTDMVVQNIFNNEQQVSVLQTLKEKDIVIIQLDRSYMQRYKYSYELIRAIFNRYVMYIQRNYQGKQPLNIVNFYSDLK